MNNKQECVVFILNKIAKKKLKEIVSWLLYSIVFTSSVLKYAYSYLTYIIHV